MTLEQYFSELIAKVEASEAITNQGKDKDGFFQPTREVLLQKLNMLRDLHAKPLARPMLKTAWAFVAVSAPLLKRCRCATSAIFRRYSAFAARSSWIHSELE